jgi:hypothetical protein
MAHKPYAVNNGYVDEDGNLLLPPDGLCFAQYDDPADHITVRDALRIANADSGIETAFALDIILEHSLL